MKEILKEVVLSIKQHKARSILTGFGVGWAMFILIILLGAGNGFRSGVLGMFSEYSSNSVWVTGYWTKMSKRDGLPQDVRVKFNPAILNSLKQKHKEIELISPEIPINSNYSVSYKDNMGQYEVKGINEEYLRIKSISVESGREFNKLDFHKKRQVVIIGDEIKKMFFNNEDAIGEYISISDVSFKVIGIIESNSILSGLEQNSIYAPDVIIRQIFNPEGEFYTFGAQLSSYTNIETFENRLRESLAKLTGFNKDDNRAIYVNNIQLQVKAFNSLFRGLNIILWVIGLCILLTGMIGVSNIMLVVVKERTQEIGIRKAIGASPNSIITLIIVESILITVLFGVIGLLFGYGGLSTYNWIVLGIQETGEQVFAKASINAYVIYMSLIIMVLSGLFAGLYPANKAAKIMPMETLNNAVN